MDFLDNAIIKAKEAIDVVSKKTEEIVTVEKQKFDINSLKSKLQKDFAKLGKCYYEKCAKADELDSEEKALVEAIKTKLEAIEKLEADIANTKGKRFCPACGSAVDEKANFCNKCGARLVFESECDDK